MSTVEEQGLPAELFARQDTSPDSAFYRVPRLVAHQAMERRAQAERVWRSALHQAVERHQKYQQALCLLDWGLALRSTNLYDCIASPHCSANSRFCPVK